MKSKSDPDLNDLRILRAVAETGSFSKASRRLGVPSSTLSRRLSSLEAGLGIALLLRSTRHLSLTDAGQSLLNRIASPLDEIDVGLQEARSATGALQGRLRVSTSVTFALVFLPAILARYSEYCPEVTVDVVTGHENIDLISETIDVALRMGDAIDSSMLFRRFGRVGQHLYAAPKLIRSVPLTSPEDLSQLRLISHRRRLSGDRLRVVLTKDEQATFILEQKPSLIFDDPTIVEKCLVAGLGFGLVNERLAERAVEEGSLLRILPEWTAPATDLYYLYHPQTRNSAKVSKFIQAVVEFAANLSQEGQLKTRTNYLS